MAIADRHGLPIAVWVTSASPHECKLVEETLKQRFLAALPRRLIGDRGYDSDPLDEQLRQQGVEMIAPHRAKRSRPPTQNNQVLRQHYCHRWRIERLWAWLKRYRRLSQRWEYEGLNFLGMVQLACVLILLRHL